MTGPLDRPADPSTTPAMTDADVDKVWDWLGIMASSPAPNQNPDWPLLTGVASLLREIDRARAVARRLETKVPSDFLAALDRTSPTTEEA